MNLKLFLLFLLIPFYSIYTTKVISIKDGDTIEVLKDKKIIRIRLEGIDCPEKDQDFGQKAKQFTSEFCYNKEVTVKAKGTDRYGRTLAEISLPDGRILNHELIKEGYAWHYKKYSSDTTLSNLEIKARQQRKGLWLHENAVSPWAFRDGKKKKSQISKIDNDIKANKYQILNMLDPSCKTACEEIIYYGPKGIQKIEKGFGDASLQMTKEHYYFNNNRLFLFVNEQYNFNAPPTYTKEKALKDGATSGWFDPKKTVIYSSHCYFENVNGEDKLIGPAFEKTEKEILDEVKKATNYYRKTIH